MKHDELIERAAMSIFAGMEYLGLGKKPGWVEQGNSSMQELARKYARLALAVVPEQPFDTLSALRKGKTLIDPEGRAITMIADAPCWLGGGVVPSRYLIEGHWQLWEAPLEDGLYQNWINGFQSLDPALLHKCEWFFLSQGAWEKDMGGRISPMYFPEGHPNAGKPWKIEMPGDK